MTSTQATPRASLRPRADWTMIVRVAAIVAVGALTIVGINTVLRGPGFVDGVTIANPTRLPLEVSVASSGSGSRLELGTVAPGAERRFEEVVDMGNRWDVRLVANGGAVAATTVPRAALEGDDWTYTVPAALADELERRGGITGSRD